MISKEDPIYFVYIHTSPSNKKYIGISANPKQRWGINGSGYKSQHKFYNAILKYGWDNFKHEIVKTNLTLAQAEIEEVKLIQQFDTYKNGYNSDLGGRGSLGHAVSVEARQKMSIKKIGKKPANTGFLRPIRTVYLFSIVGVLLYETKGYLEMAHYCNIPKSSVINCCNTASVYNNTWIFLNDLNNSPERLKFIIEQYKLKLSNKAEFKIYQYTLSGDFVAAFSTYREAAEKTGIPFGSIGKSCSGFSPQVNGYIFLKACDIDKLADRIKVVAETSSRKKSNKPYVVYQYSVTGELLATFNSFRSASEVLKIPKKAIEANCNGKCKSSYGFIFKRIFNED